jgi:hypothetical protein
VGRKAQLIRDLLNENADLTYAAGLREFYIRDLETALQKRGHIHENPSTLPIIDAIIIEVIYPTQ